MSERTARYPGVYAAMATPLTPDGKVDRDGVGRLVNALLDAGIDGLSILGSTGECNGLTRAQRQEVLATVMEAAGGRGTIFTGAAGTVVDDIVADLKAADGSGAVGALVPPPFYFPLNTAAVIDYFQYVAEASPIPIILYNIPRLTKVPIAVGRSRAWLSTRTSSASRTAAAISATSPRWSGRWRITPTSRC